MMENFKYSFQVVIIIKDLLYQLFFTFYVAQSAGVVEYTDCNSAEG